MTITRTPLHDASVCISCGVPATVRGLDHSHVVSRSRAPERVTDPTNIVLQCRRCHDLIESRQAQHRVEAGEGHLKPLHWYVYDEWSMEEQGFVEVVRGRVAVDKLRGHLVPADGTASRLRDDAETGERVFSTPALPPDGVTPFSASSLSWLDGWCRRGMSLVWWGDRIEAVTDQWKWEVGEWMNEGGRVIPEEVNGYLRGFRKEKTLMQYAWVAAKVTRVTGLSWSHHRAVAARPPSEQRERLMAARADGMNAGELRLALRAPKDAPARHACPACGADHQVKGGGDG